MSERAESSAGIAQLPDPGVPVDDLLHILANERRRIAITHVESMDDDEISVNQLAYHVAAEVFDTDPDTVDTMDRKNVYTGLYQSHIPTLDEFDIVDYGRRFIQPTDRTVDVAALARLFESAWGR